MIHLITFINSLEATMKTDRHIQKGASEPIKIYPKIHYCRQIIIKNNEGLVTKRTKNYLCRNAQTIFENLKLFKIEENKGRK